MDPNITRTVVQILDPEGNILKETVTTVVDYPAVQPPEEQFGMYL